MTQAIVMIRSLIATERLPEFAYAYNCSQYYLKRLACENVEPTWDIMNTLKESIDISCWFDEADDVFIGKMEQRVEAEKKEKGLVNDFTIRKVEPSPDPDTGVMGQKELAERMLKSPFNDKVK